MVGIGLGMNPSNSYPSTSSNPYTFVAQPYPYGQYGQATYSGPSAAYPPHPYYPQAGLPQSQYQFHNTFAPSQTAPRAPLGPSSENTQLRASAVSRKRSAAQADSNPTASKRSRRSEAENIRPSLDPPSSTPVTSVPISSQPVAGTGPFVTPMPHSQTEPPAFTSFASILRKSKKNSKVASDVWFFTKRAETKNKPDLPSSVTDELFYERPKDTKYLACRLCT
jgi:hypothetical protein